MHFRLECEIYGSIIKNHNSIYNAYATINFFLSEMEKKLGEEKNKIPFRNARKNLNDAYNAYLESRNTEALFGIFKNFLKNGNVAGFDPIIYEFNPKSYSEWRVSIIRAIIENDIVITNVLKDKGYSINIYKERSLLRNEQNTIYRGHEIGDMQLHELRIFNSELNRKSIEDVKKVQYIFNELGYYKGEISGNYEDIKETIIEYQLDKKIISKRGDKGTGNFGPATRKKLKEEYINNLGKKITN